MGIGDSGILSVGEDISQTTSDLIDAMMDEDAELISIYYGADVSREDAQALAAAVEESIRTVMWSWKMADSRFTIILFQ